MADGKASATPGTKDIGKQAKDAALSAKVHKEFRGGAGVAQCMSEHRVDAAFATKELMRDASSPTDGSCSRLKRLGRYVKGRSSCKISFPWTIERSNSLQVYVDADWAGSQKDRKSTSGGVMVLNNHLLKHWSSTQATPSLSSGEAETKAVTKGVIEGLYMKDLLAQQGV